VLAAHPGRAFRTIARPKGPKGPAEGSQVIQTEQINTSILYGNRMLLKLYRRVDEGINPDTEIGLFLSERLGYRAIPPFAGAIEYRKPEAEPMVVGLLQAFVPNQGDAWRFTLDEIARYLERVLSRGSEPPPPLELSLSPLGIAYQEIPVFLQELIGGVYLEMAGLLGKRTAELHQALASETEDPAFMPEPFTTHYQRSIFQSMQSLARQELQLLKTKLKELPEAARKEAQTILGREKEILERFRRILKTKLTGMRIRIHGDYHLGQVLYTGNDFVIIDFEGEPARPLSERRLKRSAFRDVAGMLRSFHYAAFTGLLHHASLRPEDLPLLEPWAELWHRYVGGAFLRAYLDAAADAPFLPKDSEQTELLLNAHLLNKAIYELGYELNNRPEWALVSLKGIRASLDIKGGAPLFMEIQKAYPSGLPSP
jgi:maltose alpha-D-glucosyltransferase/alpha-amylase